MFNKMMETRMDLVRNHFKWYDMSLVKISSMIFALLIVKYWDWILSADWYWYVILLLLSVIRPCYLLYKIKNKFCFIIDY